MEEESKNRADVEVVAVTAPEPEKPAPPKGRVRAYWDARNPDRSDATDEEFDAAMADYLEEMDRKMERHAMAEETFRKVAADHPELLDVVEDLAEDKEMTLIEALYRNIDPEEFLPEEGEPDFDRIRKARQERMSHRAESEAFRKKLADNLEESRRIVTDYFAGNEVPEEEQKALSAYIDRIMDNYVQNVITPEALDAFRRAMNYDKDLADAKEVGLIAGKNAKIDAVRARRETETDGLPAAGGSSGAWSEPLDNSSVGKAIDRLTNRHSITDSLFTKTNKR